jgi:hypothetical protein
MPQSATIDSLPVAFEMMKAMQDEGLGWGEDCRPLARRAMASIIEDSLAASVDAHLLRCAERGLADRRNGTYRRRILTELGDIELSVPRTRTLQPDQRGARLRAAHERGRPHDPRLLRAGAFDTQGR